MSTTEKNAKADAVRNAADELNAEITAAAVLGLKVEVTEYLANLMGHRLQHVAVKVTEEL